MFRMLLELENYKFVIKFVTHCDFGSIAIGIQLLTLRIRLYGIRYTSLIGMSQSLSQCHNDSDNDNE